jgi:GntR family transcriptional regulator/MocR family aminotransferase
VFIFVNRDYPTVSLTAERRLKLLQEYQFAIIEDDYDYDFSLKAWLCLYGRCRWNGIYLGNSHFQSFQTGFVVAPENLMKLKTATTAKAI